MDRLERLAGQVAHDLDRLIPAEESQDPEQLLEAAGLVSALTDEFTAFERRMSDMRESLLRELRAPEAKTILVVEGEPEDRRPVCELLHRLGHEVLEAGDGAAALEICESFSGPLHLLLTNVIIPDISGRELAERAALLRPDMAVIYMSGYTDEEIMFYGVLGPDVATLQMPVTETALVERLDEVLAVHAAALG